MGKDSASLFAGIRRSSLWSLLEDSGETSFSNRNDMFRFEEEEPPSVTEFSQYHGSAETERATCAPTWFPLAVSFADFFGGKEIGPPEATRQESESQRQTANPQRLGGLPAAAGGDLSVSRLAASASSPKGEPSFATPRAEWGAPKAVEGSNPTKCNFVGMTIAFSPFPLSPLWRDFSLRIKTQRKG